MKAIPEGSIQSGRRTIHISAFLIDSTEVTQGSFMAYMGWNPSNNRYSRTLPGENEVDSLSLPVDMVAWSDAILYCNARSKHEGLDTVYAYEVVELERKSERVARHRSDAEIVHVAVDFSRSGYRLPTEAEWEYAMRAGSQYPCFWGVESSFAATAADAWYTGRFGMWGSHPAAQLLPNAWGLYGMLGNVPEWTNDWMGDEKFGGGTADPTGPTMGTLRLSRGGSYTSQVRIYPDRMNLDLDPRLPAALSFEIESMRMNYDVGFRCVRRL